MSTDLHGAPPDFDDVFDGGEALDPDGPSEADLERFGDAVRTCPACGNDVYEDAALCHVCGEALENTPASTPPWALVVACVLVVLFLLWFIF